MSRNKLVKIGPARPPFARRGRRRPDGSDGKAPAKGRVKRRKSSKTISRKVAPAMLNPEKMPHIELKDFQNSEYSNRYSLYPDLCYELAKYHEGLVKSGQQVMSATLLRKTVEICQSLGLSRSDISICHTGLSSFLSYCAELRDTIGKRNAILDSQGELCTCNCSSPREAEEWNKDADDDVAPRLQGCETDLTSESPQKEVTATSSRADLSCLFLPRTTTTSSPQELTATQSTANLSCLFLPKVTNNVNHTEDVAATSPSLANLFSIPPALTPTCPNSCGDNGSCSSHVTGMAPTVQPANRQANRTVTTSCPVHSGPVMHASGEARLSECSLEDGQRTLFRNKPRRKMKMAHKRPSEDEPVKPFKRKNSRWFPEYSFPDLLPRTSLSNSYWNACDTADDEGSVHAESSTCELFSLLENLS